MHPIIQVNWFNVFYRFNSFNVISSRDSIYFYSFILWFNSLFETFHLMYFIELDKVYLIEFNCIQLIEGI